VRVAHGDGGGTESIGLKTRVEAWGALWGEFQNCRRCSEQLQVKVRVCPSAPLQGGQSRLRRSVYNKPCKLTASAAAARMAPQARRRAARLEAVGARVTVTRAAPAPRMTLH
jgi:hypothetical protein